MNEVIDTISKPLAGLGTSTALTVVSLTDVTAYLQLVSVIAAIIVAFLTIVLTSIKIKKELNADK